MNETQSENDLSGWLSTYGLITIQRLLGRYRITLAADEILSVLKIPGTFYHQLLILPLRNVFNGIIMQQVADYQLYVEKLFIDYLVSGEGSRQEDHPGAGTREDLEKQRKQLINLNDQFQHQQIEQERLIAESQAALIKYAQQWQKALIEITRKTISQDPIRSLIQSIPKLEQILTIFLIHYDFKQPSPENMPIWDNIENRFGLHFDLSVRQLLVQSIQDLSSQMPILEETIQQFNERVVEMGIIMRRFRKDFQEKIIRSRELMHLLPDYRMDPARIENNRQDLYFNAELGEGKG